MRTILLSSLRTHRRRLLGTSAAVMLGVAFLAGTLVLGDTMRHGFDDLFATANRGADVVVRSSVAVGSDEDTQRAPLDASLAAPIAAVDGVERVTPQVSGLAQIVGADGEALGGSGPPTLAANWIDDATVNPFRLAEGRAPAAPGEVVIDRGSATRGELHVGSRTTVRVPQPVPVTVVGIATFGGADSLGGATYTLFGTDDATRYLAQGAGRVNLFIVTARAGVDDAALARRIGAALPATAEAITGEQLTTEQVSDINSGFLDYLIGFLVAFSGVAMLVAAFSIHNTFTVVQAQRVRESALLRAVGATRGQVVSAVLAETAVIGLAASAVGVAAGIGLAVGLDAALRGFGLGVPNAGLSVIGSSLWTAGIVGFVTTVVAGVQPALAALRVVPLAALRASAAERLGPMRGRTAVGGLLLATGLGLLVVPVVRGDGADLTTAGIGAGALLVGFVLLGPVVAGRAASLLGAPLRRWFGVSGALARQNAMRNPRRTAGTASALMVGVGVVTLFMVFGSSLVASVDQSVAASVRAALVIEAPGFSGPGLPAELEARVGRVEGVDGTAGLGRGAIVIDGASTDVSVSDPARLAPLVDLGVRDGSLAQMGPGTIAVSGDTADERHLRLGSNVQGRFVDGTTLTLRVAAIYARTDIVEDALVTSADWSAHTTQAGPRQLLVGIAAGADQDAVQRAVDSVSRSLGAEASMNREQFVADRSGRISNLLGVVYVMLALSIVIAVMGIANTLSLSIHERRRELGLLRAVGQTRRQVRGMVRWESVLVALFGAVSGLAVGLVSAWGLVRALGATSRFAAFSAPVSQLAVVVAAGAAVGIVASIRPGRRAARVDVLAAIASD